MTDQSSPNVSVVQPVGLAIERVKQILFRPFDFGKWIAIGFCAWLATPVMGRIGSGFNFMNPTSKGTSNFRFDHARDYILQNLGWILPLVAVGIMFFLVIWSVMTWLSSRGQFMLIHCVALNRGEIANPWQKFATQAKSLWLVMLVFGGAWVLLWLPVLAALAVGVFTNFSSGTVALLIIAVLLLVCVGIVLGLACSMTLNFVVPIMYLRGGTCREAWREMVKLLRPNFGNFVVYYLFQIVLQTVISTLVIVLILCTCCIAGCLMAIPFLGSVFILPITVFQRSYSLYYLAQYGPEFDVIQSNSLL